MKLDARPTLPAADSKRRPIQWVIVSPPSHLDPPATQLELPQQLEPTATVSILPLAQLNRSRQLPQIARLSLSALAAAAIVVAGWLALRVPPTVASTPPPPGTRVAVPALGAGNCQYSITVQNAGSNDAKALLMIWGAPSECAQAAGPLKLECSGVLKPGMSWIFSSSQLPAGAHSAIVYSLNDTTLVTTTSGSRVPFADLMCRNAFFAIVGDQSAWLNFDKTYREGGVFGFPGAEQLDLGANPGEPLAVRVDRACPDPVDATHVVTTTYTAFAADSPPPANPGSPLSDFTYVAPAAGEFISGTHTVLHVQNVGITCTQVSIGFFPTKPHLPGMGEPVPDCSGPAEGGPAVTVVPGESVDVEVPAASSGKVGTLSLISQQPLAAVVDQVGPGKLASYSAFADTGPWLTPATIEAETEVFGPLVYADLGGWNSLITVQNVSRSTNAKVKIFFLDKSGDIITTLVDFVCPMGSQNFDLSQVHDIPGSWIGSIRIVSEEYWDPANAPADKPRLRATVHFLHRGATLAGPDAITGYGALTESGMDNWPPANPMFHQPAGSAVVAVPVLQKAAAAPGLITDLTVVNMVTKPGFTDFAIFVYDQNGLLDYICEKLNEKQVEYLDLQTLGWLRPGFRGSAIISAVFWEHDVIGTDGQVAFNLVSLGAVGVERSMSGPGTPVIGAHAYAFEGVPIFRPYTFRSGPNCPGVPVAPTPHPTGTPPTSAPPTATTVGPTPSSMPPTSVAPTTVPPTAAPPTSLPSTPTPLPPRPSPMPTPMPTPGNSPSQVIECRDLRGTVPAQVLDYKLAHPESVGGWLQRCNLGLPPGPYNGVRRSLTLEKPGQPYHPLFNALVLKCSCQ